MVVCQFFLRGQCKFGDNCRNEHPRQGGGVFGNATWVNQNRNADKPLFPFTVDSMTKDLTANVDKPLWPLSSYGPAKLEPTLLGGLDESQDELRVRAVTALQAGNANEYMAYETSKISAAEAVFNNARSNIQQAFDAATKQSPHAVPANTSTFGRPSQTSSAFGGANPSFGQPSFGQTGFGTTTATSAFGQASNPAPATGAFGQPVQQPGSAFGAASNPAPATGAFGQPVQHPSSAFGTASFGQTSQPALIKPGSGAFSNFGASGAPGGGSSTGGGFSAFAGRPSGFGLPPSSTTTTGGATFGQPSFGAPSAFSALAQQPPQQAPPGFGTFGQTTPMDTNRPAAPSTFGQPPAMQTQTQAFGPTSAQPNTQQTVSAFSTFTSSPTSVFGQSAQQTTASPFRSNQTTTSPFVSTGNKDSGKKQASGTPNFEAIVEMGLQCVGGATTGQARSTSAYKPRSSPYDELLPPTYAQLLPQDALEAFKSKNFEWGKVPECVPPVEFR